METSLHYVLLVCVLLFHIVISSVDDCWDETKLSRMKFGKNGQGADPGMAKFERMMLCLAQERGNSDPNAAREWDQLGGNKPGKFGTGWHNPRDREAGKPGWNSNYDTDGRRRDPNQFRDRERDRYNDNNNNMNNNDPWRPKKQPQPGVHPDDWNRGTGGSSDPSWTRRGQPADPPPGWGGGVGQDKRTRDFAYGGQNSLEPDLSDRNAWNSHNAGPNLATNDRDYVFMNTEDSANLSITRKYGYAIMALAVVVLAVLMVATIFCCNSSNSTMSQAATMNVPVGHYDAYSIYSFKGGMDTMRSSGTLGGTLHTDTMKSTRSMASPQYRVSDIDPDFARRFEKDNHQY